MFLELNFASKNTHADAEIIILKYRCTLLSNAKNIPYLCHCTALGSRELPYKRTTVYSYWFVGHLDNNIQQWATLSILIWLPQKKREYLPLLPSDLGLGKVPLSNGSSWKLTELSVNKQKESLIFNSLTNITNNSFKQKNWMA